MPWDESAFALDGRDLGALAAAVRRAVEGVTFGAKGDARFHLDPVPRVIAASEWAALEAGLAQRVRALDRFCADVYGQRRIVREGVVPERVVETAAALEPAVLGMSLPLWVGVAGLDVVRAPDGRFLVLEDNVRTPSGMAYTVVAREAMLALLEPEAVPLAVDGVAALLAGCFAAVGSGRAVVLTDGCANSAHWEHAWLASELGIELVEPDALDLGSVGVVYRRTDADRLSSPVGKLLWEPWRSGRIGLVNAFGVGVADDKLAHAYVEDMVRFYLGEEPGVASVRTYDLGRPQVLEEALDRFDELVIKPRASFGGEGVVICPHASRADAARARAAVRDAPGDYVAQDMIALSRHPTVVDGELVPRHVDLRPFVFLGAGGAARVLPGGLTRVAFDEGALVVNSSQNGGVKDTWVI